MTPNTPKPLSAEAIADNYFTGHEGRGEFIEALLSFARTESAPLIEALEMVKANDKTIYDYNGKDKLNRNGKAPGPGERFKEPREIAEAALAAHRAKYNEAYQNETNP